MHLHRAQRTLEKPNDAGGGAPAASSTPSPAPAATPTPDPGATPAPSSAPASAAASSPAPAPAPAPEPPKKDWRDDRIAKLTHDLNEERRARAAAVAPVAPQAPGESDAQFQARVDEAATEKARILAAQADWDRQCNAVADAGKAEFQDFNARLSAITSTINGQDVAEVQAYNEVLAAAMETGQAHKVIYTLGADPGEFQRLMKLTPVKRAMELGKMAAKLVNDRAPSDLPKPITPIGSSGEHYEGIRPDDPAKQAKLSTKQWMELREKQARERRIQ